MDDGQLASVGREESMEWCQIWVHCEGRIHWQTVECRTFTWGSNTQSRPQNRSVGVVIDRRHE
jgi:hypothetical protein